MNWKPKFLIIGANKGGTTSLFHYLGEHPEVFVPKIKEPMFFNYYQKEGDDGVFRTQKVIKKINSYSKLFEGAEHFKVSGESSTSYLANPNCAENIYDFNPKMKLIAVLRNPIERAFSNYLMYVRWNDEKRSFSQALKDELNGCKLPQGKQYIYLGKYLESLKVYQKKFGNEQLLIILHDDLKNKPLETYKKICNYLEIDDSFIPNFSKKYNTNDNVETRKFFKLLKKIDRKISFSKFLPNYLKSQIFKKPKMSNKNKKLLKSLYENEIKELVKFLNRDLNHWLK